MKKLIAGFLLAIMLSAPSLASAGQKIDIDIASSADLTDVLYAIAYKANVDIVINTKLEGTVIGSLRGRTLSEALDYLAIANNFDYEILDDTILIGPAETFTHTETFQLQFANLDDAKKQLGMIFDDKKMQINVEKSALTVDGTRGQLRKAAKLMKEMDKPVRQILLQVQMVELSNDDSLSLGLQYSMPSYSGTFTTAADADTSVKWGVTSDATKIIGKGKVLARPSMVTANGREATVKMVDNVPIFTANISSDGTQQTAVTYRDVGVIFIGTPRINTDKGAQEEVTMKIHPTVSAITEWKTSPDGTISAPLIASREAETTARVRSGETIVIGGLLKDEDIETMQSIPGLGDLPLLGQLFKYRKNIKEKSDVYIFVTPIILDNDGKATKNSTDKDIVAGMPITPEAQARFKDNSPTYGTFAKKPDTTPEAQAQPQKNSVTVAPVAPVAPVAEKPQGPAETYVERLFQESESADEQQ